MHRVVAVVGLSPPWRAPWKRPPEAPSWKATFCGTTVDHFAARFLVRIEYLVARPFHQISTSTSFCQLSKLDRLDPFPICCHGSFSSKHHRFSLIFVGFRRFSSHHDEATQNNNAQQSTTTTTTSRTTIVSATTMKRSLTLLLPVLAAVAIFTNTVVPVEASFPFRQPRRRFGTTNIATLTKRYPRRRHHHQQQQHLDADDFIDTVSTTSQQSTVSDGPVPSHHGVSVGSGIERPQRKRRRRSSTARPYTIRNRSRPNENGLSWVSRLTLFNIFMFGLQMYRPGVTQWGIKLSERIRNGEELYRLITPVFLHSNPGHLMSNTVSLLRLGPEVERFFGPGRFVATYLASGIVGNYVSALRTPNPSLGASGAVFGVFGAYMAFMARHEVSDEDEEDDDDVCL